MQVPDYEHMIHCPCCGAPITGNSCEYCGCVIYDFADIDLTGKPSYIRLNIGDAIFIGKVKAAPETSIEIYEDSVDCASIDGILAKVVSYKGCRITMVLDCISQGNELFRLVSKDRPYKTALDDWG